jgi:hypothetical protein
VTAAFAEIEWHDYHIVQTIEFTAADATSDLPPPMSIAEVENMTLAQKRMAAQIMEATAPDVEAYRAANVQMEEEPDVDMNNTGGVAGTAEEEELRERRRREAEEREREEARAREMQNSASAPMKIRKDYVPKSECFVLVSLHILTAMIALAAKAASKQNMTTCTICGQQVLEEELAEHMRIELLDPKWKSQRDNLDMRRAQASELQGGKLSATLQTQHGLTRAQAQMCLPRCASSHERVWIFSAKTPTKKHAKRRRKRNVPAVASAKKLFGTVTPRPRPARSTSSRPTRTWTNRSRQFTSPSLVSERTCCFVSCSSHTNAIAELRLRV